MHQQRPEIPNAVSPSRGRARIGAIVPVSNSNLEPDLWLARPRSTSIHCVRAGGYDVDAIPDSEQMRKFAEASLERVLAELMPVRPHVVLYGCTSATLAHGPDYDRRFCERMQAHTGVPGCTAAGALVEALGELGIERIGFSSPYTEQLNREATAFLEACGITTVNSAYVGEDLGNYGQSELTPQQVFDLGTRADHRDAQAVVLSCTDMRALEIIDALEQRLGKPVVSSNQALAHAAARRLQLPSPVPGALGQNRIATAV